PEVSKLRDEPLVALRQACKRGLDTLLADLPRARGQARVEEAGDVRARRALLRPLGDAAPEPRSETGDRVRVADRAVRHDAQEDRVAVAVVAELDDDEVVPGRLALAPEPAPGAAPEPRVAALARAPLRLLVHPREHQDAPVPGVLDDRRSQRRIGHPRS